MLPYINAFVVGGLICTVGQVLIDKTQLTTARITVLFVMVGCVASALGLYQPLVDFAGAGATVPITGFGHALAKGVQRAVDEQGFLGVFTGGLSATAAGITAALVFSMMIAWVANPKEK